MAHSDHATTSDGDSTEPPAFNPRQFGASAYEEIDSHDDLIRYSKGYFAVAVAHYDLDVDAGHVVGWEVSTRAKRRAAAVKTVDLSNWALVINGMTSPDWGSLREQGNDTVQRRIDGHDDVKDVTVQLTWGAFETFDEEEWRATIRHEAVHVEQFHQHGTSDHGLTFEARANDVDASTECPKFTDYEYPFECRACGDSAGGRYRDSKAVTFARLSADEQDEWIDDGEGYWTSRCCDEPVTLAE